MVVVVTSRKASSGGPREGGREGEEKGVRAFESAALHFTPKNPRLGILSTKGGRRKSDTLALLHSSKAVMV